MNIFEGARRIGKLIIGLWIVGWCIAAFVEEPSIPVTYLIYKPGAQPVVSDSKSCGDEDRSKWKDMQASDGKPLSVTLCFVAATATDGTPFIPTSVDPATGNISGYEKYSTEVSNYTEAVTQRFQLSADIRDGLAKRYWNVKAYRLGKGTGFMLMGIAFMLAFFKVVGWIVRGFLGIPRGQDKRPA